MPIVFFYSIYKCIFLNQMYKDSTIVFLTFIVKLIVLQSENMHYMVSVFQNLLKFAFLWLQAVCLTVGHILKNNP